jgi:hypothetical protein
MIYVRAGGDRIKSELSPAIYLGECRTLTVTCFCRRDRHEAPMSGMSRMRGTTIAAYVENTVYRKAIVDCAAFNFG